ncbi:MAG TPA: hypothetical protein VGQ25_10855 [Gemmatimonadales bacterium]|jgi:hypothetical protein|nr:hypothetical protein [Gemmatimonadales bacterium]
MGTFLFSASVAALALQAPIAPADTLRAALWVRVATDSTDGAAWLEIGRAYTQLATAYHAHRAPPDTGWARAVLDTADLAFERAAHWSAGTRTADSAQVFRVDTWGRKAYLAWETSGVEAAIAAWQALAEELRPPPVLEELGENLLRACPRQGVLLTAGDADTQAAWYMRYARGLRPDLLILPLALWRSDTVFRRRVLRDAKLRTSGSADAALRTFAERRPVCASMAFERPPEMRGQLDWKNRPLVWVAGPEPKADRVPPQDFVFAALRLALDQHDTWSAPALTLYRRAADITSALCRPLGTFGLKAEVGCR